MLSLAVEQALCPLAGDTVLGCGCLVGPPSSNSPLKPVERKRVQFIWPAVDLWFLTR